MKNIYFLILLKHPLTWMYFKLWWVMVDIFRLSVGDSGWWLIYFGWWWVVVAGAEYIFVGGGWWWVVVGGDG